MLTTQLSQKYAKAIFEVAVEENKIAEFGAELSAVGEAVEGHQELKLFISNPQVKAEAKKEVFGKLFKEEVSPLVYNFFMLLIDKRREALLKEISLAYKALANEAQGVVEAKVTVASALSPEQKEKLVKKLEVTTGKKVVIETKIDQSILGGVIVRIGDKLIDGSVVRQMQALKAQLLAN